MKWWLNFCQTNQWQTKCTWEEAGQEQGLGVDAIAEAVIGMAKDEKAQIEAKFDEDFELVPIAGKTVSYGLEVLEVRQKNHGSKQ